MIPLSRNYRHTTKLYPEIDPKTKGFRDIDRPNEARQFPRKPPEGMEMWCYTMGENGARSIVRKAGHMIEDYQKGTIPRLSRGSRSAVSLRGDPDNECPRSPAITISSHSCSP